MVMTPRFGEYSVRDDANEPGGEASASWRQTPNSSTTGAFACARARFARAHGPTYRRRRGSHGAMTTAATLSSEQVEFQPFHPTRSSVRALLAALDAYAEWSPPGMLGR